MKNLKEMPYIEAQIEAPPDLLWKKLSTAQHTSPRQGDYKLSVVAVERSGMASYRCQPKKAANHWNREHRERIP
ncbi:hypothetical protein [Desulfotalea psychrophila]|uniref:hypothetical protein n=1 Tax=Desulfotalea psychrophila TaxID=84980 RepID=UPI00059D5DBA|nr:hypothetical protein [Desulfotalea psychrophila]